MIRKLLVVGLIVMALNSCRDPARPASAASPPPSILFVLTDDQPYESVSNIAMPYLNSRPGGHWVTFPNAFVNSSLCCPSRATLLSGQYSFRTGVENNSLPDQFDESQTLFTWLHDAGYRTGLFGKLFNGWPYDRGSYVPPGIDKLYESWGYFSYDIYEDGQPVRTAPASAYETDDLAARTKTFIESTPADQPFFAYLSVRAPHAQWYSPVRDQAWTPQIPADRPSFNEADVSDKPGWVKKLPKLTATQIASEHSTRTRAYRTLGAVDDAVRTMMSTLTATGRLDNTVIVFMSDNGFAFGEHRYGSKPCPYDECSRVPLLVRYPTAAANVTVPAVVDEVDVSATLLDLAGVTPTLPGDGRPLTPLLDGTGPEWRDGVLLHWVGGTQTQVGAASGVTGYDGVRTSQFLYVEYVTGELELYDLARDPYALTNRKTDPAYAADRTALHDELVALRDG